MARGGVQIGVMPFRLVGLAEEDSYLASGLADEITNALSRFRWMFIVSSNSLGRFTKEQRDEAAIRREFGIDFLLDGSVQRSASKIRVSLRLVGFARQQPDCLGTPLRPRGRRLAVAAG